MAFASEVRTEILENLTLRKKFRRAQGYGLLLCSKHFDAGEISMTTERQEIAQLYRATLRDILGKGCEEIPITRTGMGNATRHYAVALSHPASRQKVLEYFGQQGDQINAEMIARECGATVHNCAIPDSYLSMKYEAYSDSYPLDAMSLYLVTASFCGGDYTLMDYAAGLVEDKEGTQAALDTLKSVDFSSVDTIVIMYDLSDYADDRPVMDENNDINLITWNGALNASIQLIQKTFPHIRIVILSPTYGQYTDGSGNLIDADTQDLGNGTLPDYVLHEIDVAMANGVSIIDNYYGAVSENQAEECLTDGWRLNEAGRQRIADRFAKLIYLIGD